MLLTTMGLAAQALPDVATGKYFASQVKSVDEFIQRFNGQELHPDVTDTAQQWMYNLVALFDYQMPHKDMPDSLFKQAVLKFANCVKDNGVKLQLTDADMYAEVQADAQVLGREVELSLVLQSQTFGNGLTRWAIVGVKGLKKAGVVDTTNYYGISPVEHEIRFMGLGDIFEKGNNARSMGYRGKEVQIDELSVLLALGMVGEVRILEVNKLTMHCLEVPGYVFTINEQNRGGSNSGWLISNFWELGNKKKYINELLGK